MSENFHCRPGILLGACASIAVPGHPMKDMPIHRQKVDAGALVPQGRPAHDDASGYASLRAACSSQSWKIGTASTTGTSDG